MPSVSIEQSRAFVEKFSLPPTGDGPLAGLRFAVKDLIDVAGHPTGCGNPTWLATHPPAVVSAVCVEQLLAAGARCEGKTVTDELALSLLGENHFYGTPLNPAAPQRVPGGSSSGSASAVACGLVDFALGTDSGGSVRVPASNCGIWGWRPTHGLVSVAGVMPLAPTYDTVGLVARSADVLERAASVLLASELRPAVAPATIHIIIEAFDLADEEVRQALQPGIARLQAVFDAKVRETSLSELCGDAEAADLSTWLDAYRFLMGVEAWSCFAAWMAAARPTLGPLAAASFEFVKSIDRTRAGETIGRRERYGRQLRQSLGPRDLLCLPSAPAIAPLKGTIGANRDSDYYWRTLSLTAIAGVGRLPQVSMPLATVQSAPIGLSLVAAPGEDMFLLELAKEIDSDIK
ncbi:MAG: amidase [Pirellulales bacterium]